ncbi:hypothetical protein M3Y98_00992000 [Aphelenchoides besseyi]|nr:hypothetical protein M3Y98_00992000 [Aphelenchoides besseyi]KAI6194802.1 hypothetical protein M3Y96_01163800 [Aphelenchoides besseyi]
MALFQLLFFSISIAALHAVDHDGCFNAVDNSTVQLKGGSGCQNASTVVFFAGDHVAINMEASSITNASFWIGMGIKAPCPLNVTVLSNNGSGASSIDIDGHMDHPTVLKVYSDALFFGNETKAFGSSCENTTFFESMEKHEGWKKMPIALVNQLVENFTMNIYTGIQGPISLNNPSLTSSASSSFAFYSIISKVLFVVGLFVFFH